MCSDLVIYIGGDQSKSFASAGDGTVSQLGLQPGGASMAGA